MLICRAGGAPPAGPGKVTSVLIAIRFQFVTSFACAAAGAASAAATANAASQVLRIEPSPFSLVLRCAEQLLRGRSGRSPQPVSQASPPQPPEAWGNTSVRVSRLC